MYMNGVFMVQEEVITEDHPHRENGKIEKSLKESEPLELTSLSRLEIVLSAASCHKPCTNEFCTLCSCTTHGSCHDVKSTSAAG